MHKINHMHLAFEREAREVLGEIRKTMPEARIASGAPADVKGLSDIDILVFRPGADEARMQKRIKGREVNILITGDPIRRRALAHREWELREMRYCAAHDPQLLDVVVNLKRGGLSTEAAWCVASWPESCDDPYEVVALAQEVTPRRRLLAGCPYGDRTFSDGRL